MKLKVIFNRAHKEEAFRDEKAIIFFSARWCEYCNRIAPYISPIANEINDIKFYKMDINEMNELLDKYEIKAIPAFISIKKGEKTREYVGCDIGKLLEFVQEVQEL